MHLSILHRTTFTYAGKAHDSFNEVRLRPIDDAFQKCVNFDLRLEPTATPQDYSDFYGNTIHYFDIAEGHTKLIVEAQSLVETTPNDGVLLYRGYYHRYYVWGDPFYPYYLSHSARRTREQLKVVFDATGKVASIEQEKR